MSAAVIACERNLITTFAMSPLSGQNEREFEASSSNIAKSLQAQHRNEWPANHTGMQAGLLCFALVHTLRFAYVTKPNMWSLQSSLCLRLYARAVTK